jgi:hypothetical protein
MGIASRGVSAWLGAFCYLIKNINPSKIMSIIISQSGTKAVKVDKSTFDKEDHLQRYIYENPESIPLYEIKDDIRLLILAREFPTNSGPIDAIGIDQYGELYIVETKLYKNPDKRTVISQALDYGAALWKHANDFSEFLGVLDSHSKKVFGIDATEKIRTFFDLTVEETQDAINKAQTNLNDGVFHFVVLMDQLDDRLKDLILYVNQNSQFDIYAVELEYYKHDTFEIIIPRIFGAEVKKDIKVRTTNKKLWDWESFKDRLSEYGEEEVNVAGQILSWAENHGIQIDWSTSQRGGYFLSFETPTKYFYPFSINGHAKLAWNAPHQGPKAPAPFDAIEMRAEILKKMQEIDGATVDLNNIDGFNGLKLPLRALVNPENLNKFLKVCIWIQNQINLSKNSA